MRYAIGLALAVLSRAALASPATDPTLAVAVLIDRQSSTIVGTRIREGPFAAPPELELARAYVEGRPAQIEVVLTNAAGLAFTRRIEIPGLCLAHAPDSPPHVAGDTIELHREGLRVDLPARAGFDRVELGYYVEGKAGLERRSLGTHTLPPDAPPVASSSTVAWPEAYGDPDVYRVYGDPGQASVRVNVVIVPDGYTYAQKSTMEQHAQQLVDALRATTPYAEHDPFIHYTLVYAYSLASGTDQCDCDIVVDTAMGTHFPEDVPACGSSANRCLFYGSACDTSGTANIVAAELRAPLQDETLVMVNTTRFGGCAGARAVFAAANGFATYIAGHELAHSWPGLADEYDAPGCGSVAGELNTSTDAVDGAWPEWIADVGAPREGAQYFEDCLYRPEPTCKMRSLLEPFCRVCNQRWSLATFGHPRVAPTAPLAGKLPAGNPPAWTEIPLSFEVLTRLSVGEVIENLFSWSLLAPGSTFPTPVGSGSPQLTIAFSQPGTHRLTAQVVADTNFVKPERWGANRDFATWTIEVERLEPPPEISSPGTTALRFTSPTELVWQDASGDGVVQYNLYRGDLEALGASYGACLEAGIPEAHAVVPASPALDAGFFYLVTGVNPLGEGPLGEDSAGNPRPNRAPCPRP